MFPKTLGGVSFEKAGKLFGGRKTKLFRCVVFPSPKPPTFPCNDQRGIPFGNPKTCFFSNISKMTKIPCLTKKVGGGGYNFFHNLL